MAATAKAEEKRAAEEATAAAEEAAALEQARSLGSGCADVRSHLLAAGRAIAPWHNPDRADPPLSTAAAPRAHTG